MSTAADSAGPPEETPGATPSRADGPGPRAAKGGAKAGPARKTDSAGPGAGDKTPDSPVTEGTKAPAQESRAQRGDGGGPPPGVQWRWRPLLPYALAGLIGGLLVAAVLVLTGEADGIRGAFGGREADGQNARIAAEAADQAAELRRRVEALALRLDNIDAAATKLGDLEQFNKDLVGLDTRLARLAGEAARIEARLGARLETLEALTPDDLPQRLDRTAGRDAVETLAERVGRLERDEMSSDIRRAALALALANLTRAAETPGPFVNELSAIEALDPGNAQAQALRPFAESGLPSVSVLAGRFERVADEVVRAHRKADGKGVLGQLWDSIRDLFRVRPVGEAEGADAPAIVARTEQRLHDGDLRLAVRELAKLGAPGKGVAAEWLAEAEARLRLDRLVSGVNAAVLQEIARAQAERKALREQTDAAPALSPKPPEAGTEDEAASGAPER